MALSGTALTETSAFTANVYPPQANSTVLSNDVAAGEQALANRTKFLNDTKVDRDGDVMTGLLDINQGTTNANALEATGNGTGKGIDATGGANGGGGAFAAGGGNNAGVTGTGAGNDAGVVGIGGATGNGGIFNAGGGNANGASCLGSGSGSGLSCTGGPTGPGITATPGTAQTNTAPTCAGRFAGYIQLTGTDPNEDINPGANNVLHGANTPKAWCVVLLFGSGPYNIDDGYNIDEVVLSGTPNVIDVTFARAMANANYSVNFGVESVGWHACINGTKTTSGFQFSVFDTTSAALGGSGKTVSFQVFGRQ